MKCRECGCEVEKGNCGDICDVCNYLDAIVAEDEGADNLQEILLSDARRFGKQPANNY